MWHPAKVAGLMEDFGNERRAAAVAALEMARQLVATAVLVADDETEPERVVRLLRGVAKLWDVYVKGDPGQSAKEYLN